jgi:protein phosphatase inhibitor 2
MSEEFIEDPPHLPPLPRSASNPKPKGILKNTPQVPGVGGQLAQNTLLHTLQSNSSQQFAMG